MAIPKKGSRTILVDGLEYRWLIRRKATDCQVDYGSGYLHVGIQGAEPNTQTLVVFTNRRHPQDIFSPSEVESITPSDISIWIRMARLRGWDPTKPGKQIQVELIENADRIQMDVIGG